MSVVVRFAPSPTGFLHLGGARTALFNWLYARHCGGRYLLRIEDTDRARSTPAAIEAILEGLRWLGLEGDEPPVFQSTRFARHREVAERLLAEGKAYRCWCTPEELEAMRARARAEGRPVRYDRRCRERPADFRRPGVQPVVRLKVPTEGETVIEDLVQGTVRIANAQLDDMVLLRSDGTPTYMLSVVVDDHDMGITHVIRGDDHLTNAFRQLQLYRAMGVEPPAFAHIPLIHGPDGTKLSKRHGAVSLLEYREMGFLPEAMRNYLVRLGWSLGDREILTTEEMIRHFDIRDVGRSPARFDMDRLLHLNAHWLRQKPADELVRLVEPFLRRLGLELDETGRRRLLEGMAELVVRARTLVELAQGARIYVAPRPLQPDAKAMKFLGEEQRARLARLRAVLAATEPWTPEHLEEVCRAFAAREGVGFGKIAQPLRAALTGTTVSPPIFEVMRVLGREEVLARLDDAVAGQHAAAQQSP